MAPPRLVSGAGEGESWDGVERSDMVDCDEKGAGGLWPQGAGGGGGDIPGCWSTEEHGQHRQPPLDGAHRKEIKESHERGHGATKQRAWCESAEQHGAAWRSGPASGGPRTHEDGGARGAPRWRAALQP